MASKALTVQYLYERNATQNADITVFGETTAGFTADSEIVMHVPKLALSDVLTQNSNWTTPPTDPASTAAGESVQPQPDLELDWEPIMEYLNALHAKLADSQPSGLRTFADDAGVTAIYNIGKLFASESFSWDSSILDSSIPAAAVRKIKESELTVADLYTGLQAGPRAAAPDAGVSADSKTLRSLFEQAVNAGLVTKENQRTSTSKPARSALELSSGDSIDIYVKYKMSKTRRQEIDADITGNNDGGFINAQSVTLTFGGVTFDVALGGAEDEISNVTTHTYKVKLVAKEVEAAGDANEGKITVAEGGSAFVARV